MWIFMHDAILLGFLKNSYKTKQKCFKGGYFLYKRSNDIRFTQAFRFFFIHITYVYYYISFVASIEFQDSSI